MERVIDSKIADNSWSRKRTRSGLHISDWISCLRRRSLPFGKTFERMSDRASMYFIRSRTSRQSTMRSQNLQSCKETSGVGVIGAAMYVIAYYEFPRVGFLRIDYVDQVLM